MELWMEHFARANFRRSADTAHDLKTPLNVAVLNLELLRMRIRKLLEGADDEKVTLYTGAIETELRRMGRIFDAFFLLSTPPKNDEPPEAVDLGALCLEAAEPAGFPLQWEGSLPVVAHEARIRQAVKLFFEGASRFLAAEGRDATIEVAGERVIVAASGSAPDPDADLTKLFKFYYSDAAGNADLSLAVARLIAETYGGELAAAASERDKVALRLSFPLGAR